MLPTLDQLKSISKAKKLSVSAISNANSILVALDQYGPKFGMDLPHRLAHYLSQLCHEDGGFVYDKEIWGNTPAQKRYDTRTDLGNTKEADGDGKLYMGRSGIQLTGKANYMAFTKWVRVFIPEAPDFVAHPDLINTDPYEGLVPIWFWSVGNQTGESLNKYADNNDLEMITRKINGGLNGLEDRLDYYSRVSLVLLDYDIHDMDIAVRKFQGKYGLEVDGSDGPQTRAKLHEVLAFRAKDLIAASPEINVKAAPVTQVQEVPVTPKNVDKPAPDYAKIVVAGVSAAGASPIAKPALDIFGGLTPTVQIVLVCVAVGILAWLFVGRNLLSNRAKTIQSGIVERAADGLPNKSA